ncbi:hypothetical protein V5279_45110 [Bradyrhizobium sp. 26S5]
MANTAAEKLRSMIPAAGAIAYPFLLDAFHLAVSPADGPMSFGRLALAALCLLAATAAPLLGLACAWWMTTAAPSSFELRARRLAYICIAAPPLFVLTGVGLGLLHIHVSDELVWVAGWSAACLYVLLAGEQGLDALCRRGWLLVDATYQHVDKSKRRDEKIVGD